MRMNRQAGLISGLVLASGLVAQAANVNGKVTLKGTPPAERTIDFSADPQCAQMHRQPKTTSHYVVAQDGGLANVFVYVKEGLSNKNFPAPTDAPLLDQQGCIYQPYVLGVRVNQTLKIKNSDPTLHNVHAQPKINKEFNFAQPMKNMVSERKFEKPEVLVRFKCDVHPWMFAFVGVVEHPYFAVSGKDGSFSIPNLPAGKYVIEAVHPKGGVQTQEVNVTGDGAQQVAFNYEVK